MKQISFIKQDYLGEKSIFFVGGEYKGEAEKTRMCGQMFVEAYRPKIIKFPYPLILFHGAGQTNTGWLMTPDGRMGMAEYFVSQGFCVYLAEQPARGRSAYHPELHGVTTFHSVETLRERFASSEGPWTQAEKHTQWPGEAALGDEIFKQFAASQVESVADTVLTQKMVLEAGTELLQLVGPAVLLTHSQAGSFGWILADACPELVKGIVALEPFGPPFSQNLSDAKAKNYGLSALPLHFEPAVTSIDDFELELLESNTPDRKSGWVMKEPARQLPHLAGISILILTGEASYHAGYDYLTSYVLNQAGVSHDFIPLETVGICGNGHMMMLEKNNLQIAEYIRQWMAEHIE